MYQYQSLSNTDVNSIVESQLQTTITDKMLRLTHIYKPQQQQQKQNG